MSKQRRPEQTPGTSPREASASGGLRGAALGVMDAVSEAMGYGNAAVAEEVSAGGGGASGEGGAGGEPPLTARTMAAGQVGEATLTVQPGQSCHTIRQRVEAAGGTYDHDTMVDFNAHIPDLARLEVGDELNLPPEWAEAAGAEVALTPLQQVVALLDGDAPPDQAELEVLWDRLSEPERNVLRDDPSLGEALEEALDLPTTGPRGYVQMATEAGRSLAASNPVKTARETATATLATAIESGAWWLLGNEEQRSAADRDNQNQEQPADAQGQQDHPSLGAAAPAGEGIVFRLGPARIGVGDGDGRQVLVNEYFDEPRQYDPPTHGRSDHLPEGLQVRIVETTVSQWSGTPGGTPYTELRAYARIVTEPDQEVTITEDDDVWTRMDHLIATGRTEEVSLADGGADEAAAIEDGLPEGRSPGESSSSWSASHIFAMKTDDAVLDPELYSRVTKMLTWAVDNDMLVGNAIMTDGVRSPKTSHRMSVAYNIQHHPERTGFEQVKALPDGTDVHGNVWYEEGDTHEDVKARARSVRAATAPAAEGYDDAERAAPNPPGLFVSYHTTGNAIDCFIPWRKKGSPASSDARDPAGWEEIYNQFGLCRPVSGEDWHIELLGDVIGEGVEETGPAS